MSGVVADGNSALGTRACPVNSPTGGEETCCPECGSEHLIADGEIGEVYCGECGVQLPFGGDEDFVPPAPTFGDGQSVGGVTFEHLPDKNLPTDFRLSDVKGGPEQVRRFASLRWLNHIVPQRDHQAVYRNVSLRIRPLLERINLPSAVVNRAVLKAGQVVSEHGLLRVDGTYEALALFGLMHADKRRFLRIGRRKLIGLLSNAAPRELHRVELGEPDRKGRGVREWALSLSIERMNERAEGLCFLSAHLYYRLHDEHRKGPICHLTSTLPVRFLRNATPNLGHPSLPRAHVVEKQKDGFYVKFSVDPSTFLHDRDAALSIRVTLLGDAPLKKAYVALSNGGAFHVVQKAYNMWCTLLGERADPATVEELNELNPQIPRHRLSEVNARAHYFKRLSSSSMFQPISDRVAAAVACYDVLVLPAKQVAPSYEVSEGAIKAHHKRLTMRD